MRLFFRILYCVAILRGSSSHAAGTDGQDVELHSFQANAMLDKLDLTRPELENVKREADRSNRAGALSALLEYYRGQYPLHVQGNLDAKTRRTADNIVKHILQWGPYEPADYGPEIDWEWDPRGDIEWVAAAYRFYWAEPLAGAYAATRDEAYARAFVELTSDWIAKHPLENRRKAHPVYTHWRGFAWLDIQTGIRATNLCKAFPVFVHSQAFTPEFLGVFLASLYDHQVKTERLPMNAVHNKAVFEQRGFLNVAYTFPEFRDARRWTDLALERTRETFLAQTTADGVQREWSGGYNLGVLRDAVEIMQRAAEMGVAIPDDYRARVHAMYDYLFAVATPELAFPMFGDCSRDIEPGQDRSRWPLYGPLMQAAQLFGDAKYAARAKGKLARLPKQTSYAFREAGMYALRSGWSADQIYLALHCSPPAISSHDQPDNGTFELYAYGRWLMPDTGYYTYGHDADARKWHRQSSVHQTLTVDGKDIATEATQRLWHTSRKWDAVVVENKSYPNLIHRRTVWFVDKRFFVLLDEAIGDARGMLDIHFQFAPGEVRMQPDKHSVTTLFPDANVLVWAGPEAPVTMEEEPGWFAWSYGHRTERKAFRFRHVHSAPAVFLTALVPYQGTNVPEIALHLPDAFQAGMGSVEVTAEIFGKTWKVGRDLVHEKAWMKTTR